MTYRPVGFGSHHWETVDAGGARWWATVDDLTAKPTSPGEPLTAAFDRLHASLATARALHEHGRGFAVAPLPASDGRCVRRIKGGGPEGPGGGEINDRYAIALYPYVE